MTAELEILQSPRYLAGTLGDLELTCYRNGIQVDAASAGTVTVTDAAGTVLSTGAATIANGKLRYTPTAAAMASVNLLTVSWASVVLGTDPAITLTSYAEVVGDMLFTLEQARAHDGEALRSHKDYPDALIREAHDAIHDAFEEIVHYALGLRYRRATVDGSGEDTLLLPESYVRTVRSVETRNFGGSTWTALTGTMVPTDWGGIRREDYGCFEAGTQNVRVSYEAGRPIPGELRRAALVVLRNQLVKTDIDDRATSLETQLGTFRVTYAGEAPHWFGLPAADAVLWRYREVSI